MATRRRTRRAVTVRGKVAPPPPGRPADAPLNVRGTLLNAATGYPLQGLTVQVLFVEAPAQKGGKKRPLTPLGSGISGLDGAYLVAWDGSAAVTQKLCLLANCQDAQFTLQVSAGGASKPLLVTQPTAATGKTVVANLTVPIAAKPVSRQAWSQVGRRLHAASLTKLSDLVAQLVGVPPSQSLFRDWPLAQRHGAVAQLESAFLDPHGTLGKIAPLPSWQQLAAPSGVQSYRTALGARAEQVRVQKALLELSGKVTTFSSLSSVDWTIDPNQFTAGPAAAITANQSHYYGPLPQGGPFHVIVRPELGYRDYLRTQWTAMDSLVVYVQPHQLTQAQSEQQLRNRFHQDFRTQDTSWVAANEILIPILTEILTAPAADFGFGLTTAQIPPRGAATARQYLSTLIGLTKLSAQELTLRYRTDFTRPDTATSDAVWENIYTLQGFFRDSFQSVVDPLDGDPDVLAQAAAHGQPVIPEKMHGRAPWFLEYQEWLQLQQPIPFENYVQIRQIFQISVSDDTRKELANFAGVSGPNQALYQFYLDALALQDQLLKAYQYLDQNEYKAALDILGQLQFPIIELLYSKVVSEVDVPGEFAARHGMAVKSLDDLQKLLTRWQVGDIGDGVTIDLWAQFYQTAVVASVAYVGVFALPFLIAQASAELGDSPTAVLYFGRSAFFAVGKATTSDGTAYRDHNNEWEGSWLDFPLYHAGNLPYTVDTESPLLGYPALADDDSEYWGAGGAWTPLDDLTQKLVPAGVHPVESRFFRLQMGGAMLDWADALYRSGDDSSVWRARELYKGVYFLHGAVPPINPDWGTQHGPWGYFGGSINPAQASQLARAELGFTQISAGLNFFGYADDMVPILRYSTLKPAADSFAAAAKSAEEDFLNFMANLENATIENMKDAAMLQKANLAAQVAQQQSGIAQDQVKQAQILVTQVNQQITALQQQIADHDSFWGELGDFVSGLAGIAKGLPSFFTSGVGSGVAAEAGFGSADTAGLLGLGAGASVMAGFGAFYVASYMTMSSMADAQNQRGSQLGNLENQNLPSAQAQLDIAQRSVTIANLQQQIAQADAQLATQLLVFAKDRYLSIEFWSYMASLLRRVLRAYLDLGTRMGWLAQRALSYEQNAPMGIIQMDYYPAAHLGAGGADKLQLDLADLEAQHLDGLKEMIPVKYTVSIARDFPLQFAQLLTTGQCLFYTPEQPLQWAYPGTFAYRIVAVTPTLTRTAATAPVRGLLSNGGISQISSGDGSKNLSVRPADALPISEFNLGTTDMQIWGLPGGTLMQFEGSGVETLWKLEFPAAANPSGLANLADVLVTMDLRAQYSPSLYQTQLQQMPTTVTKFVLVSAFKLQLAGLADLQGKPSKATIAFDLTAVGLPAQEKSRTVNNLAVMVIGGKNTASIKASVTATKPAQTIALTLVNGTAFSNAPPVTDPQSTAPLSPLNVLAGVTVDQTLSLVIDKTKNAGVDFTSVQDVLLGVDYTASV